MSEHTKEPWLVMGPCAQWETARIFSGSRYIGSIGNSDETESETRANARRIVACVNACAGMKDPEMEIAALRAEVATPVLVATNRLADSLADARAQRDELLAALKMVADDDTGALEAYEAVRSAIANAEKRGLDADDKSL